MGHAWSTDPEGQAAIRAAEDAAAVPTIPHRDIPDVVAELRERVARLEAAAARAAIRAAGVEVDE